MQPKALYAGDVYQGQPGMVVTEDEINLWSDAGTAIHLDSQFGILLAGKLSLSAMPDQISIGGGYWRFNPMLLSCVPSTTPTPVPVLVRSTPEPLKHSAAIGAAHSYLVANSDMAS